jgi:uncharacterized YccA/Bax inhibitor family protein
MLSNPAIRKDITFAHIDDAAPMTIRGTVQKTGALLAILCLAAFNSYCWAALGTFSLTGLVLTGALGGLVVAWVTISSPEISPVTAPLYAILEGVALGAVTFLAESSSPGIAIPTVGLTLSIMGVMLMVWHRTSFRTSLSFKRTLLFAMVGILGVYITTIVLAVSGVDVMWLHTHPVLNTFAALIATLCFLVDFDEIEKNIHKGAPAHMEWYSAFGLMLTLVWLYLELLKLMGSSD